MNLSFDAGDNVTSMGGCASRSDSPLRRQQRDRKTVPGSDPAFGSKGTRAFCR